MAFGHRFGSEKKIAHGTAPPRSGKAARIPNLSRFPSAWMRLLFGLLASLPLSALHALGTVLGWAMYGMSPTYRRHLRDNLESAGYRDARVRRAAIAHAGCAIMEVPALWFRPQEQVAALVREADGVQAAFDARDAGKALMFLTPHLGAFEVAAQYAAQRIPITVLYRRPKMAWLDPL